MIKAIYQRIITVLLALTLIIGVGIPAFAAEDLESSLIITEVEEPEEPGEPEEPEEPGEPPSTGIVPPTGDSRNVFIPMVMLLLGIGCITGAGIYRRRGKGKTDEA